jgi:hypothetical protein
MYVLMDTGAVILINYRGSVIRGPFIVFVSSRYIRISIYLQTYIYINFVVFVLLTLQSQMRK